MYNIRKIADSIFQAPSQDDLVQRQLEALGAVKNPDGSYDVSGNVKITKQFVRNGKLTIRFNKVKGKFYCSNNNLTSLEGGPSTVGGDFHCYTNNLTSLEGGPSTVEGSFDCSDNKKKFTKEEAAAICDVKGKIYV